MFNPAALAGLFRQQTPEINNKEVCMYIASKYLHVKYAGDSKNPVADAPVLKGSARRQGVKILPPAAQQLSTTPARSACPYC
jgi:hypothetical protein